VADQVLVFLSYTQVMRRYPPGDSFVASAEDAINAIESAKAHHMEYFAAADMPPAEYSIKQLRKAAVFVGLVGLDFGSRVRGDPARSYTELEFDSATQLRLPRLVFLLDPTSAPLVGRSSSEVDPDQARFRRKLEDSGATVAYFATADELKYQVHAAVSQWIREASAAPGRTPVPQTTGGPSSTRTARWAGAGVLAVLATAAVLALGAWSAVAGTLPPWSRPPECPGSTARVVSAKGVTLGPERGTRLGIRLTNRTDGLVAVPAARDAIVRSDSGRQLNPESKFADDSWFFDVTVQARSAVSLQLGIGRARSGDSLTVVIPRVRHGTLRLARCTVTTPAVDPGGTG
jgi:hypothetical protein